MPPVIVKFGVTWDWPTGIGIVVPVAGAVMPIVGPAACTIVKVTGVALTIAPPVPLESVAARV